MEEFLRTEEGEKSVIKNGRTEEGEKDAQAESVERNVERKPRVSAAEQDLAVLPLTKVVAEVLEGRLRGVDDDLVRRLGVDDRGTGSEESIDVGARLLDIALDVHGEARGLGEGEAEVESESTRDGTETNDETPDVVEVAARGVESVSTVHEAARRRKTY